MVHKKVPTALHNSIGDALLFGVSEKLGRGTSKWWEVFREELRLERQGGGRDYDLLPALGSPEDRRGQIAEALSCSGRRVAQEDGPRVEAFLYGRGEIYLLRALLVAGLAL